MPYFVNIVRTPKAGKTFEVLEAMKKAHAAAGQPGSITVPISGSVPPRPSLVALISGFETLDDIDKFHNGYLANTEAQKRQMALEELCDANQLIVSEMLAGPEFSEGYEPEVVSRLHVPGIPGKIPELIDCLLEVREKVGGDAKNVVSRPLGGPITSLRVTTFGTTLQDLDDNRVETMKHLGKIPELLSGSPIRFLGRIVYRATA